MFRTFHHRFTLGSKCGVLLFALLAIYLFWIKAAVAGCILIVFNVLLIERVLHSEYIFDDDTLTIYRGRFAKARTIRVADIKACRPIKTAFGMSHYLRGGRKGQRVVGVEPKQEASCIKHLQRRVSALSAAEGRADANKK